MSVYTAGPHPHLAERRRRKAPQVADEHVGFNGWLAVLVTRLVGTMWAVYFITGFILIWMALGIWGPLHPIDPYPFAFLLFLGNVAELMLLSIILVGQAVLGAAHACRQHDVGFLCSSRIPAWLDGPLHAGSNPVRPLPLRLHALHVEL